MGRKDFEKMKEKYDIIWNIDFAKYNQSLKKFDFDMLLMSKQEFLKSSFFSFNSEKALEIIKFSD